MQQIIQSAKLAMIKLNLVETSVSLVGEKVHFVSLKLSQTFYAHHQCEILVDYEELDKSFMNDPIGLIKYIGEPVFVEMSHHETHETTVFSGLVTDISMVGRHGQQGYVHIQAASQTIRLEGKPSMDSFVNRTLEEIVSEVIKTSGNGAEAIIKPKYKKQIAYLCKYEESAFQFLNRLGSLYGEAFFNDGATTYFGLPNLDDAISIKYDAEITSLNVKASLLPTNFERYDYLVKDDEERIKQTRYEVPEATGYLKAALDKSEGFYTSEAMLPLHSPVGDSDSILNMVDIERTRTMADMLTISGTSQTCKIAIGKVINVTFPNSMNVTTSAGDFIITNVIHEISQEGKYSNTFSGIRAALERIPVPKIPMPVASSQRAIVVSNSDPEGVGRIQVRFQWQQYLQKTTNWLRIIVPDGGSSNMFRKNRGFVFIPEKYDEVIVNFENNDPSKPYVSGSLFSTKKGEGGGKENHLKSIRTRNGHRIEFDDSEETLSITIKDKNDNTIHLDTNNKTISILSIEKINIKSKEINLSADEINLSSKNTISTSTDKLSLFADEKISIHSDDTVDIESFNILNIAGKESYFKSSDVLEASATEINIGAESDLLISGASTTINGEGNIKIKAPNIEETMTPMQYPFKTKIIKREAIMSQTKKR